MSDIFTSSYGLMFSVTGAPISRMRFILSHHQPTAHRRASRSHVWCRVCKTRCSKIGLVGKKNQPRGLNLKVSAVSSRRKGNSILEVDDEGGRMFLRVLTHLTMHDYPPLVSGALQLLFRHFSQRQEVLQTFKQVHTRPGEQKASQFSNIDLNKLLHWQVIHIVANKH